VDETGPPQKTGFVVVPVGNIFPGEASEEASRGDNAQLPNLATWNGRKKPKVKWGGSPTDHRKTVVFEAVQKREYG